MLSTRSLSGAAHGSSASQAHALTVQINGAARPTSAKRPASAKKLFTRTVPKRRVDDKISVTRRPYSASHSGASPYAQKLTSPVPERKASHRKAQSTF